MRYPNQEAIIWQFDTANFRVVCSAEPCQDTPDFDDDGQTAAMIERGAVEWFDAIVSVWLGSDESDLEYAGHDALCQCAYTSFDEFVTSHRDSDPMNRNCQPMRASKGDNVVICHYFPSMVTEAIRDARRNLAAKKEGLSGLRLRAA